MGPARVPRLGIYSVRLIGRWLSRLSAYGTEGYPPHVRRRLKIMNVTAYVIALFTLVYAFQQMFLDFQTWKPVIIINFAMAIVALSIPFLHRYGELVGPMAILVSELVGIFILTSYVGRDTGLHMQYFAAPAAFFVILGLERLKLIVFAIVVSIVLYLLAWLFFVESAEGLIISAADVASLHVTAVATTFCVISIVLYYAFRLVEQAEAKTDALLHNILPSTIVNRLVESPGTPSPRSRHLAVKVHDACGGTVVGMTHQDPNRRDVVVDADWRLVRTRIETGSHSIVLEPDGDQALHGIRDGERIEVAYGPGWHLDYLTPAMNAITAQRLGGTSEIDVVYIQPVTLEPVPTRQRYELVRREVVETAVGKFVATRWHYTALATGWESDLWVADDVVMRYDRAFELISYEAGATGPVPVPSPPPSLSPS